ncbi:uncharacterized protein VP01_4698g2 [Puccinia sorghi]|uniref:DDE Tnp4 domain-containing protein n=1 Tax=Puccinia sorghi TaxID=27349 RepID=A0A0L6UN30_9BASI|nr:uncharacterized protein VP01_4698g2 [Puccinia sorghi]
MLLMLDMDLTGSKQKQASGRFHQLLWSGYKFKVNFSLHSSLHNVIERKFGVLKHHFKILATTLEYKLEQQYKIVIAFCCVHNINIICNVLLDDLFSESNQTAHVVFTQDTKDTYNDQHLLSN